MQEADMRKLLPQIKGPAMLVVGESDLKTHEREWLRLLGPGASHVVIRGGKHV
jgi:pimeloyl-ACP methyl ester carboxylesterase